MRVNVRSLLPLWALLLMFFGMGSAEARLNVVTTTQDPAAITQAIGGERVKVVALCKGYQDPHTLDARPSYMVELNKADLVAYIGLELEIGYLPALIQGARNPKLAFGQPGNLDLSQFITPMEVSGSADRSQGDVHPGGNPHYWLDPENARKLARGIAARLSALDPAGQALYSANLATFEKTLTEKAADWAKRLSPLAGKPIVTYHRSWSYFAARYKLNVVGYVEPKPGIPPSPTHTLELMKTIQTQGVKIILSESFYDKRVPELIASKTGAKAVFAPNSVNGEEGLDTYFKLLDRIVAGLEKAIR